MVGCGAYYFFIKASDPIQTSRTLVGSDINQHSFVTGITSKLAYLQDLHNHDCLIRHQRDAAS